MNNKKKIIFIGIFLVLIITNVIAWYKIHTYNSNRAIEYYIQNNIKKGRYYCKLTIFETSILCDKIDEYISVDSKVFIKQDSTGDFTQAEGKWFILSLENEK